MHDRARYRSLCSIAVRLGSQPVNDLADMHRVLHSGRTICGVFDSRTCSADPCAHASPFPGFMRQGSRVQFVPVRPPLRQVIIHKGYEPAVVMALQEMSHFVYNHVL